MTHNAQNCPKCGAPIPVDTNSCAYCGTWLVETEHATGSKGILSRSFISKSFIRTKLSLLGLPPGKGEFGTSHKFPLLMSFLLVIILYFWGWQFEDKQYWLNDKAMTIWVGANPLILFIIAIYWKTHRNTLFVSILASIALMATHLSIIWMIRGSLWDDHIGVAALVSGVYLISWALGRFIHIAVRIWKIQP